jgi:K+-sensing histidine kinase KdpD
VLSGTDPGRHWSQPMTLVDVARAAAAEVEEYQRVDFLPLADLEVAGHAAVDVNHLLAELIKNATAFSPPNTKIQIAGEAVPHAGPGRRPPGRRLHPRGPATATRRRAR